MHELRIQNKLVLVGHVNITACSKNSVIINQTTRTQQTIYKTDLATLNSSVQEERRHQEHLELTVKEEADKSGLDNMQRHQNTNPEKQANSQTTIQQLQSKGLHEFKQEQ